MLKVGVVGASGRMGRELVRLIHSAEGLELAAAVVGEGSDARGKDAGELAGVGSTGVVSGVEIPESVDVVVDFSAPAAMLDALRHCVDNGIAFVSGTTGLGEDDHEALKRAGNRIPLLWAPNMSLGVRLCRRLVREAAAALKGRADIEIVEAHHRFKKDAPSGTGLALGQAAAEGAGLDFDEAQVAGRAGDDVARRAGDIGISAIRAGNIVGEHTVIFGMDGERIEITHRAQDRSLFARGALDAARFVVKQDKGLYTLDDLLGI